MDKEKLSTQSLVFGILSLVLSGGGILSIIFGAIGKAKAKAFAAANDGVLAGKAKVGKVLSTIGLVCGIIATIILVICIILAITNPDFRQMLAESYGI